MTYKFKTFQGLFSQNNSRIYSVSEIERLFQAGLEIKAGAGTLIMYVMLQSTMAEWCCMQSRDSPDLRDAVLVISVAVECRLKHLTDKRSLTTCHT